MKIYVSALQTAHKSVVDYQPQSIISFIDTHAQKPYFLNYDTDRHLILPFDDVSLASDTIKHTQKILCAKMIQFLTSHDMRYSLLIHCTLGISRSTAAAYIALNLHHKNQELQTAQYLRSKIPYAVPNITLVSIADTLLGKAEAMTSAIDTLPVPDMTHSGGCVMVSTDFL